MSITLALLRVISLYDDGSRIEMAVPFEESECYKSASVLQRFTSKVHAIYCEITHVDGSVERIGFPLEIPDLIPYAEFQHDINRINQ